MRFMSISDRLIMRLFFLGILLLLTGCLTSAGSNAGYLLDQDFQKMSNAELTAYEQELSDEIGRSSGSGSGGTSLGFGLGSWGSHTGFGLGVEQILGSGGNGAPVELRDRREAVRVEMRRRGLLPPATTGTP